MGVQIQIDDFGVGYSSLSYLAYFTINAVKIDRSFVSMVTSGGTHSKIIQAIIMLAHGLGMEVIAEGLETEEQMLKVRELGCEYGQGKLVLMPEDSEKVNTMISRAQTGELFLKPRGKTRKNGSIAGSGHGGSSGSQLSANLGVTITTDGIDSSKQYPDAK
jgi:predicted signal transduction protein with EAL and GGDEF domain